ncbi:MAG: histidine phosphatase family protein [Myxococcales bacterium]|nr:histidine phosphatase family protein [Myxococcales bacterium]
MLGGREPQRSGPATFRAWPTSGAPARPERLAAHRNRATELLVSPTRRTRETAAPVAASLRVPAAEVADFEEIRLPKAWEGAPAHRVSEALRALRASSSDAWHRGHDGGESFSAFGERVRSGLLDVLSSRGFHPPQRG